MKISWKLFGLTAFLFLMPACDTSDPQQGSQESIIMIYTNDEHGWMEPSPESDGAAGLLGLWKNKEGYDGSAQYLILSGGDMWTGPAISTWYEGEPMVQVMNAMGYDAAALGNHEFDFKLAGLEQRVEQMNFPILCANIRNRSDGSIPDFVDPYLIKQVGNLKIGIIGLANTVTPLINFSFVDENFEFISYEDALEEAAAQVESEGANIILLISHLCDQELSELVPLAKSLGISIIGGGHCHDALMTLEDNVLLIKGGGNMSGYARVTFNYDELTGAVELEDYQLEENIQTEPDKEIETIVQVWQQKIAEVLSEEIGYCASDIDRYSVEMANLVTDSWLMEFPDADISVTNSGGIRQTIFSGAITKNTIVGLLPFANEILELDLTGSEVLECIGNNLLVGGMSTIDGNRHSDGTPLKLDSVYKVLTTDYLYSLPANSFSTYDDTPVYTATAYRDPLINYLSAINTSQADPLENYLDYTPRR